MVGAEESFEKAKGSDTDSTCQFAPESNSRSRKASTHDLAMAIKSCVLIAYFSTSASAVGHKTNSYLFYFSTYILYNISHDSIDCFSHSSSSSSSSRSCSS